MNTIFATTSCSASVGDCQMTRLSELLLLMKVQETQGLLSPALRGIRLRKIAEHITPGSVVLDLGCGAGYLATFLPRGCRYFGVDRVMPPKLDKFTDFHLFDLNKPDAVEVARTWLDVKPDYITCAAVVEHLDAPLDLIGGLGHLIPTGSRLVGTTAHPRGRWIHAWLARIGLCSRDAANEHKGFLDYGRIEQLAEISGGRLVRYELFLLRLNQLFIVQY